MKRAPVLPPPHSPLPPQKVLAGFAFLMIGGIISFVCLLYLLFNKFRGIHVNKRAYLILKGLCMISCFFGAVLPCNSPDYACASIVKSVSSASDIYKSGVICAIIACIVSRFPLLLKPPPLSSSPSHPPPLSLNPAQRHLVRPWLLLPSCAARRAQARYVRGVKMREKSHKKG